jgi:hypothetical protein
VCGRRLDAHWVNQRPGYRCRHGHSSARTRPPELAKNIYVREDHLLGGLRNRQPELVGLEDATVAEDLRAKGLVIVCRDAAWTAVELVALPAEVPHVSPSGQQFLPLSRASSLLLPWGN